MEQVILINELDEETGAMEKMEAHRKGILHRAFSVFIFNKKNEMLLQQRAFQKYHSGGLWTNACCSHPKPGEITEVAAARRLKEELGFETSLEKAFEFVYYASFENGLTENEFDHVFVGYHNGEINFNKHEVKDICFRPMQEIESNLQTHPSKFTAWFSIAFPMIKKWQQASVAAAVA
ncbi:MAG: isopentenyl-diphosphate Delta-isomerase [Bacteroidetes bacterium]|nr:isopentenyl-diphosphate Delta-isomerase [Bacteroidota bacterium]